MRYQVFLALILLLLPRLSFAGDKDILVIESYHSTYTWDISYKTGLESVISTEYQIHSFEMNTKRLPKSTFESRAELAWQAYENLNPALVILADDNALKYVGPKFIGSATPVVYLGINNNPRKYGMYGHRNITGVLERPLLRHSVEIINKIIDLKKVLVMFDSGTTAAVVKEEILKNQETVQFRGGITVDISMNRTIEQWEQTITSAKANGYDAIFVGLYHTLTNEFGKHVNENDVLAWTAQHSPLPIFAFWDFAIGKDKTIGGYVLSGQAQGKAAGEIAMQILSGQTPVDRIFPHSTKKGHSLFSRSQLEKWGLVVPPDVDRTAIYID